ncbi:MAG: hypothetical protein ABSD49_04665 [Candidatus Bathyarchaeia archaeon]
MTARLRNLKTRIEKLGESDLDRLPSWLREIPPDLEDVAEYRAILQNYTGFAFRKRYFEFVHRMRRKYPQMPVNIDERVEAGGRAYIKHLEGDVGTN